MPKSLKLLLTVFLLSSCTSITQKNIVGNLNFKGIDFIFSESVPDEISVLASGTGSTKEDAIKNALKESVQKGMGVLVISNLHVLDQKQVIDELINYSSGFVKQYQLEECIESKIFKCKIIAKVSPWNFKKINEEKSDKEHLKINGKNLLAQHLTQQAVIEQRKKITEYYFSRIRKDGFKGIVDAVDVIPSAEKNKVKLNVRYRLNWNKTFREELLNFLELLEKDTGGGFENYNEHTDVYIPWSPTGMLKSRVYIKPHDESYMQMMKGYISAPLAVTIQPFGECEYFDPGNIFYMGSGNGSAEITVSEKNLTLIEEIHIDFGCN